MRTMVRLGLIKKMKLLATSTGRRHLWLGATIYFWPLLRRLAGVHRRTLARSPCLVAVVGSYGKTTTVAAVATALAQPVPKFAANAYGGVALKLLGILPWQPHAVFEVGIDGPGQMSAYATMLQPDIVVVTSIGMEHHRSLGTLDRTREEKSRMVQALRSNGVAVLNGDDQHAVAMAKMTNARVMTFGFSPTADVRATDVRVDWPNGTLLTLQMAGLVREVRLRLLGRVMVYPFLAAMAVALAREQPLEEVISRLEAMPAQPGRLQIGSLPNGAWMIRDEFKSSLETVHAALDVMAELPGRRIIVIGSVSEPPGSQGPVYRDLGRRLAEVATRVIVVGPMFQRYAAGATAAGMPRHALTDAKRSVRTAWQAVLEDLQPGDVVLVKGRDTERLDRVALALEGRHVRCDIDFCDMRGMRCQRCPKLETGWGLAADSVEHVSVEQA